MNNEVATLLLIDSFKSYSKIPNKENLKRILILNDAELVTESSFNSYPDFLSFIDGTLSKNIHLKYFLIREKGDGADDHE